MGKVPGIVPKAAKEAPPTKKEKVEIAKMRKLWSKTNRILRARSASKYIPLVEVHGSSKKKRLPVARSRFQLRFLGFSQIPSKPKSMDS